MCIHQTLLTFLTLERLQTFSAAIFCVSSFSELTRPSHNQGKKIGKTAVFLIYFNFLFLLLVTGLFRSLEITKILAVD